MVCAAGGRFLAYALKRVVGAVRETVNHVSDSWDYEAHLNRSLDEVIELLEREIVRLKESLETYRLSQHPQRAEIIRWHVRTLDERQDALEELRALLLAQQQRDSSTPPH